MPVERSAMLGAQLWVIRWVPREGVTAADVQAVVDAHLKWMLGLEAAGHVVASGPLTSGPGVTPGGPHGAAGLHGAAGRCAGGPGPLRRQGTAHLRRPRVARHGGRPHRAGLLRHDDLPDQLMPARRPEGG